MDAGRRPRLDHRRRPDWLALWVWLCAGGLVVVMAGPMLVGRVYTYDDLGCFHLPVRAFYAEQLARHEPFDWMPQLFCGFSLTGEGQAGTYHPMHWLLYRLLPLRTAWPLEVLASYPFMLAGAWLLLKRRLRRSESAALGAMAFTFCGFNLLHFVHPNAIAIVAHIPWLLWAIDVAMLDADPRHRRAARIGVALLTGSQLLLGYPQYVWFSLVAEAAWGTLLLIGWPGKPRPQRFVLRPQATGPQWAWLAVAKATGFLLGGAQLLPTMEALALAARRSVGPDFANLGSLHALNLVQLVSPYFFAERSVGITPHEAALYLGAVPLTLLVWLRTNAVARQRLRGWGVLALLGLAALFLAFGPAGQLYRLQQLLPLVSSFRCPCRYLVLFELAMICLSAAAFGELARQCRRVGPACRAGLSHWSDLRPLAYLLAVAVAVSLAGFALRGTPLVASRRFMVAGVALIGAAVLLVSLASRGHRWALAGLVLLAAADLGLYGMTYAVYRDTAPLDQYVKLPLVPPGKPDLPVAADLIPFGDWAPRSGNQMLLAGWSRVDGYAGLEPGRRLNYRQLAALRVAGVGWVRRTPLTEQITGLAVYNENWLRVPEPLPYARLVAAAVASQDPGADLPGIPIESSVLVPPGERGPESFLQSTLRAFQENDSRPLLLLRRPGRMEFATQAEAPRLLAVAESFHPGWRAAVDGQPTEVLRVNGDFLGCLVGPGEHRVGLEFRPDSLRWGLIVSLSGAVLVLLSGVILVVQSQRRLV